MYERLKKIDELLWMYEMKDFQTQRDKEEIRKLENEKREILEKIK